MKLSILVTLVALSVASEGTRDYHNAFGIPEAHRLKQTEGQTGRNSRIIGGFYSYLGNHPFFGGLIISLASGLPSICGSTLVSDKKLVTAAHCWDDGVHSGKVIEVVLGSIRLFSGGFRFTTDSVIAHQSYNPITWENDIAIILAPNPIKTSFYIKPISLPGSATADDPIQGIAVGFGRAGDWAGIAIDQPLMLQYLDIIDNEKCTERYGVNGSIICTTGTVDRSPCDGDAGGPLYYYSEDYTKSIFLGVMSFGSRYGCRSEHPYVHTSIAAYIDFIVATF